MSTLRNTTGPNDYDFVNVVEEALTTPSQPRAWFPWVSRRVFDAERLLDRAIITDLQRRLASERESKAYWRGLSQSETARANAAETRAAAAEQRAVETITEARRALADAVSLSKAASTALFAVPTDDVENPMSVGRADREAGRRMREEDSKR